MASLIQEPVIQKNVEGTTQIVWQLESDYQNLKPGETLFIQNNLPVSYIRKIESLTLNAEYDTNRIELNTFWSWSHDKQNWSNWLKFDQEQEFEWLEPIWLKFRTVVVDLNPISDPNLQVTIYGVTINAITELERGETVLAKLEKAGECKIIIPQDFWKIFSLEGFELVAGGTENPGAIDLRFRASFDSKRTWSEWQPMTNDNLHNMKFDPLRFVHLEIQVCKLIDDDIPIQIWDLLLIGDFQNVSADYKKSGIFGMRSDCRNKYLTGQITEDFAYAGNFATDFAAVCDPCATGQSPFQGPEFVDQFGNLVCSNTLFNPYTTVQPLNLYNTLTDQSTQIFGWEVDYYQTNPDRGGRDMVLHEYQLKNVVRKCPIKIMIPDNKFPERTIQFNQFDLELFDSFEVHITRSEFKKQFGPEARPEKFDFLFICENNILYQVEHALLEKDFLNASVYYKVILKKAQKNAHVRVDQPEIQSEIDALTNNSSIDALFGEEVAEEMEKTSDLPEQQVKTHDQIRQAMHQDLRIVNSLIENSTVLIARNHYDLSQISPQEPAIVWQESDHSANSAENRTFIFWARFKTISGYKNLIHNQIITANQAQGYKIGVEDGILNIEWGMNIIETNYQLEPNIWYCIHIEMNQSQQNYLINIFKRKNEQNPRAYKEAKLISVFTKTEPIQTISWQFNTDRKLFVFGSDILLSNIRIFKDLIKQTELQKILHQYQIADRRNVILIDNVNQKYSLPDMRYRNEKQNPI